jgi:hypothetical protein
MYDNQIIVLFNAKNRDSPVCAKSGVLKFKAASKPFRPMPDCIRMRSILHFPFSIVKFPRGQRKRFRRFRSGLFFMLRTVENCDFFFIIFVQNNADSSVN